MYACAVVYINTHIGMYVLHNVKHSHIFTYIHISICKYVYMFGIYGIYCVVVISRSSGYRFMNRKNSFSRNYDK